MHTKNIRTNNKNCCGKSVLAFKNPNKKHLLNFEQNLKNLARIFGLVDLNEQTYISGPTLAIRK
jgi:hypothetical protein